MAAHLTQANLVPAVPFDWFLSPNEGRQAPAMRPKPAGPPGRAGPVSDLVVGLRLPPEQEEFGLDEAVHGEGLYKGSGLKVWPSGIGCSPPLGSGHLGLYLLTCVVLWWHLPAG